MVLEESFILYLRSLLILGVKYAKVYIKFNLPTIQPVSCISHTLDKRGYNTSGSLSYCKISNVKYAIVRAPNSKGSFQLLQKRLDFESRKRLKEEL